MTHKDILKNLKKKEYSPVYCFHGEEAFYIDMLSDYLEKNVLNESEKAFNLMVLYGKDVDHLAIIDNARRYPMMSEKQVVIVKEAQQMKDLDKLVKYIEQPMESTILVLCHKHKKLDARKKLGKLIQKKGVLFESKKLYDNQVASWVENYLKENKTSIQPDAAQLLADYLGANLNKIANELDKLMLNVKEGTAIDKALIQKNIGISKDFNVFELQTALAKKDVYKVNLIVNYFISNPKENPIQKITSSLYSFFSNLYVCQYAPSKTERDLVKILFMPKASMEELNAGYRRFTWRVKDFIVALRNYDKLQTETAIACLREYDLRSKGVNSASTNTGELLRELFYLILH